MVGGGCHEAGPDAALPHRREASLEEPEEAILDARCDDLELCGGIVAEAECGCRRPLVVLVEPLEGRREVFFYEKEEMCEGGFSGRICETKPFAGRQEALDIVDFAEKLLTDEWFVKAVICGAHRLHTNMEGASLVCQAAAEDGLIGCE
jgi:hypothetical protein